MHEVLAWHETPQLRPEWCAVFDQALAAFNQAELELARRLFQQVIQLRGGADGPSSFYLDYLTRRSQKPLPPDWTGVVVMADK